MAGVLRQAALYAEGDKPINFSGHGRRLRTRPHRYISCSSYFYISIGYIFIEVIVGTAAALS
jgi:hypothetical protein